VNDVALRAYAASDEDAAIALWRRSWQAAYPALDFAVRLAWWHERWRSELVPVCTIVVAERASGEGAAEPDMMPRRLIGFVTIDPRTGYLDQIVVAPEAWGSPVASALLAAARRICPAGLDLHVNQDNRRAIRFYEKQGFAVSGTAVNPRSGAPIFKMSWRASA
jgi:putative acetyltransferase